MAVVVDVLKLTQVQGVCAVRGTAATGTIALATTLKKSTETQSSPKADIKAIHWTLSASASAKIQRNSDILYELRRETELKCLNPIMLSGKIQGNFLAIISKLIKPFNVLEIGTYTGYGTLCLAEGLAAGGKIFTIDRNEELLKIQNKYFEESGNRDRIVQLTGNAIDILDNLNQTFDLIFIDADKENYLSLIHI